MGLSIYTVQTAEPVSLTTVKLHLRVSDSTEDTLIAAYITAAREYVERVTRRQLALVTYDYTLDAFPTHGGPIALPRPPLVNVSSIKYVDAASGSVVTLAGTTYTVIADREPGIIALAYGQVWPLARQIDNAVTIRFGAGYSTVPSSLVAAMLLIVGDLFESRQANITGTIITANPAVEALLTPYRVMEAA